MKKKVGVRVLSLLLSCVLLGTMLPAAVAADPAPNDGITVDPSSIALTEGESLPIKASVTWNGAALDEDGLKGAGLSIHWESGDSSRVSVESTGTLTTKVTALKTAETTDEKEVTITAYLKRDTVEIQQSKLYGHGEAGGHSWNIH